MKKVLVFGGLILALVISMVLGGCPAPAPTPPPVAPPPPTPAVPEVLTIATFDIGSVGFYQTTLHANAITEKFGTKMRVIPCGGDGPGWTLLLSGDVDFSMFGTGQIAFLEGFSLFAEKHWGPMDYRIIRVCRHPGWNMVVRGDSDIYTIADFKGKKGPICPGYAGGDMILDGYLAFGGLTRDDIEVVEMPSSISLFRGVVDGVTDFAPNNASAAYAYELAAQPWGLRWIPTPHADKEGWKRLRAVNPVYTPGLITKGAGFEPGDEPIEGITLPYPTWGCLRTLDEDVAYFMAKALDESYEIVAAKDEWAKALFRTEDHWAVWDAGDLPLHDGAIRYYKDIGQWTAERQAKQDALVEHYQAVRDLWDATLDEALAQEVKTKDWPEFWMKAKAEAGF